MKKTYLAILFLLIFSNCFFTINKSSPTPSYNGLENGTGVSFEQAGMSGAKKRLVNKLIIFIAKQKKAISKVKEFTNEHKKRVLIYITSILALVAIIYGTDAAIKHFDLFTKIDPETIPDDYDASILPKALNWYSQNYIEKLKDFLNFFRDNIPAYHGQHA